MFRPTFEPLEKRALLTAFVVNSLSDSTADTAGTSNGTLTLREALTAANTDAAFGDAPAGAADGDTITFGSNVTGNILTLLRGELAISDDVRISGDVELSGNNANRVFNITNAGTVTLDGLSLTNGRDSGTAGGGAIYTENTTLTFTNGAIAGNTAVGATGSGGGVFQRSGTVGISNSTISGNVANRAGGGIEIDTGRLTLTNVELGGSAAQTPSDSSGNFALGGGTGAPGNGGGLHVTGNARVDVVGGTVTGNVAALEGGGLWNSATGVMRVLGGVTVSRNTAQGNAADDGGGGVFNNGGTLAIELSTLRYNFATGTSGSGGGLFTTAGTVTVNRSTIADNSARRAGGGIEATVGTVTLTGSTLRNNTAGTQVDLGNDDSTYIALGDSITFGETDLRYIPDNGTVTGYPTIVADFLATQNGGSRPNLINLAIDGETAESFQDNTGRTPPVVGRTDTPLQLQNTNYAANNLVSQQAKFLSTVQAETAAGRDIDTVSITLGFNEVAALASQPNPLSLIDATLATYRTNYTNVLTTIRNAAPDAQLILLNYYNPFVADDNKTPNPARDLFAAAGPRLNAIIQQLAAQFSAAYVDTATPFTGREAALTYIDEVGNGDPTPTPRAPNDGVAPIGNVHPTDDGFEVIASQVIDAIDNNTLTGNPGNGGGLHVTGAATVNVVRGLITGNGAASEGGGLWNSAAGRLLVSDTEISKNYAQGDDATNGGGGVFNDGGTVQIASSGLIGNAANGTAGSGGGLFSVGGSVAASRINVTNNVANRAGGGIELIAGGLSYRYSTLNNNIAGPAGSASPGNGGGLHTTGAANVAFFKSSAVGNTAASEGGGLWLATGARLDSSGSAIGRNTAQGDAADNGGGGLFNDGGNAYLGFTTIYENAASGAAGSGGGVFTVDGDLKLNRLTIRDNTASRAGGGVEVFDGNVQLLTAVIQGNKTGPMPGNGGGLHVSGNDADVLVSRSFVNGNTAASEGGGLWNQSGSRLRVEGTDLLNNVASGAAADNGGGGIFNNGGRLTVAGSRISSNVANGARGSGGGVHLAAGGNATFSGTRISNNRAFYNGGGLYNAATLAAGSTPVFFNRARFGGGVFTDAGATTDLDRTRNVYSNVPDNLAGTGTVA